MTAPTSLSDLTDDLPVWAWLLGGVVALAALPIAVGLGLGALLGRMKLKKAKEVAAAEITFEVLLVAALAVVPAALAWFWETYWEAHKALYHFEFSWGLLLGIIPAAVVGMAVSLLVKKRKPKPEAARLAANLGDLESLTLFRKDRKETHKMRWAPRRPVIGVPIFNYNSAKPSLYEERRSYVEHRIPPDVEVEDAPRALHNEASDLMWPKLKDRPTLVMNPRFSLLGIGPPDSAKSSNLVVPMILSPAFDRCNLIVASVKDELLQATWGYRSTIGHCTLYDPVGESGLPTQRWSFLDNIRDYGDAQFVATNLISQAGMDSSGDKSDYFKNMAIKGLSPLLLAAAHSGANMATLLSWTNDPAGTFAEKTISKILANHPDGKRAITAHEGQFAGDAKPWSQTYATIQSALIAFNSYRQVLDSADTTTGPIFHTRQFLSGVGNTHYLTSSRQMQKALKPLFVAHLEDILLTAERMAKESGGKLKTPLVVIIDEAAHSAPIPSLPTLLATARSMNITFATFWQGADQIIATYGDPLRGGHGETVINASLTKVILPGASDAITLQLVDRLAGQTIEESLSETVDDSGETKSENVGQARVSLLPVYRVREMRKGMGAICHDNKKWVFADMVPWYVDPELRARGSLPAPKPPPKPPMPRKTAPQTPPSPSPVLEKPPEVPPVSDTVRAKRQEVDRKVANLSARLASNRNLASALADGMHQTETTPSKATARSQKFLAAVKVLEDATTPFDGEQEVEVPSDVAAFDMPDIDDDYDEMVGDDGWVSA